MGNDPRWVPAEALVEVTCKVMQGLFLLRPSRDLNEIVNGILARAVARYEVAICAYVVLSNHMHLLLVPADAEQLGLFHGLAPNPRFQPFRSATTSGQPLLACRPLRTTDSGSSTS